MSSMVVSGAAPTTLNPIADPLEIESYFDRLWPILRSITGDGVRRTHEILREIVPFDTLEVPSGTRAHDWVVPPEWVVRAARLSGPNGEKVLDVRDNNLHLLGYSAPFRGRISRKELDAHLYSLPDLPDAIPYVTSYYERRWGLCLPHRVRAALPDGEYEVMIDTEFLESGSMTYSEAVLRGDEEKEVLFSTYTCHPSMANNELSGPLVTAFLYRALASRPRRRLTYRFLFLPETIGAITYLSQNGRHLMDKLSAGYVLTCVGNPGPLTFKRSRRGDSLADRACTSAWRRRPDTQYLDFFPSGSDERQYCSPGYNLPVGTVSRTFPGRYAAYHTSFDDKSFVSFEVMADTVRAMCEVVEALEGNRVYQRLSPYCEPQLGSRGLMSTLGAARDSRARYEAIKWFLNLADGTYDVIAMAERSGLDVHALIEAAQRCVAAGLAAVDLESEHSSQN